MTQDKIEQELEKELGIRRDDTGAWSVQHPEDPTHYQTIATGAGAVLVDELVSRVLSARREVETEKVKNAGLQGQLEVEEVAKGIHFELVDILVNYRKERGFGADAPSLTEELNNILVKLATLERENAELKEKLETMKGQRDLYKRCLDELRIAIDLRANSIANKEDSHA